MLPLSLYIHIPWCIRKCPYCDFNSHKSPNELPEERYVSALIADLNHDLTHFPGRKIDSIFIGGGTPSLFSAKAYETLFNQLQRVLIFDEKIEITLEANPGAVEQQRFNDYRSLGINRLSLGIQSFNPTHLKALGRVHDDQQARRAIESARLAGFDNINIDIMHGLPQQSMEQGLDDLRIALSFKPEHLSWYQLTIEPNTVFYKKPPQLPTDDDAFALEEEGFSLLAAQGFEQYEISAFCRPNRAARHNLNYWLFGDYFGIGAGAHGKLTTEEGIFRTRKYRQPNDYLSVEKAYLVSKNIVSAGDLIFEFMLNTTRLNKPIDLSLFYERTGLTLDLLMPKLLEAQKKELVEINQDHWHITPLGRRYTNDLQALFLPD